MAGTIPLSMTQQFTALGKPLAGGKLYIFQTATTTPQNAYSDSGLTATLPNPILLGSSGRVPQFFLADGSIKARLTDKAGVIQDEWDNLLVVGASSGSGGSGSTVDPNALLQTGMCIWLDQTGVLSGFVRDNARTIGSATSGATERANSDTQALFTFLWQTYSDTLCPVITGRGASAAADWAANKQITLPDKRGLTPIGVDDMGNTSAGRLASVTFTTGNNTTVGSLGGAAVHTLTILQLPVHHFNIGPNVWHSDPGGSISSGGGGTPGVPGDIQSPDVGGGQSHNNMQPFVTGSFYRKL